MLNESKDKNNKPSIPGGPANRFALVFLLVIVALFGFFFITGEKQPATEIPYSRITSYNVCYTKLLRCPMR